MHRGVWPPAAGELYFQNIRNSSLSKQARTLFKLYASSPRRLRRRLSVQFSGRLSRHQRLFLSNKAEIIHWRGPCKTREAVELATLEWVSWFNHERLLEPIGYIPPADAEANDWRQDTPATSTTKAARVAEQQKG